MTYLDQSLQDYHHYAVMMALPELMARLLGPENIPETLQSWRKR